MVKWSVPARNDLKNIHDYIARDSKFYALRVSRDIIEKSEKLNALPMSGRIVPEISDPNIREVFIYSYRLIYKISSNVIEILAVVHGKQNFSSSDIKK